MLARFLTFCCVIPAVFTLASSASATESRIKSLGGQELYTIDDTDIFSNPALCYRYPEMLRLHTGGMDAAGGNSDLYAYGGFNVTPIGGLTLGAFFGRHPEYEEGGIKRILDRAINDSGQFVNEFGYNELPTHDAVKWQNPADLLISYRTKRLAFGIGYYTAAGKYEKEDDSPDDAKWSNTDYEIESRLDSIKAGAAFTVGRRWTTELWAKYIPWKIESDWEADGVAAADDESSRMVLEGEQREMGARVLYRLGEGLYLVPAFRWEKSEGEVSYDTAPDTPLPDNTTEEGLSQDYMVTDFEMGLGLRYENNGISLVGSASMKWSKERYEFTETYGDFSDSKETTYLAAPVIGLGMECRVLSRLNLRWGINTTALWAETDVSEKLESEALPPQDKKNETYKESVQNTAASIGLGFNFGSLSVDAVLGEFVLAGEPGSVAGEGPVVFSGMDVKYSF